jgi:hypothetical protein
MPPDIARFSAEQTAEFFGGGELGRPQWADPEVQRKQDAQRELLRAAVASSTKQMASALSRYSPESQQRLLQLSEAALAGDAKARRLFVAMYTELLAQALLP